jgi:acetyltransferase-like isoleucine patch superfamily enzyme
LLGACVSGVRHGFSVLWRLEAQLKGVQFEGKALFVGRPIVSVAANSTLLLGDNVNVTSSLRANPLACFQPSVLRTLEPGARLVLGKDSGLSGAVICAALSVEIGEGALIGSGAMILDNDFHPDLSLKGNSAMRPAARPVKIGRNVFIGTRAIILKGVTIGDRAVIGAGAVVTKDVPADHIAAGNPSSVFPKRRPAENAI